MDEDFQFRDARDIQPILQILEFGLRDKTHHMHKIGERYMITDSTDDIFGVFRLYVYRREGMTFAEAYTATGSFPMWFPAYHVVPGAVPPSVKIGQIPKVVSCAAWDLEECPQLHKNRCFLSRFEPDFVAACLWSVIAVWLGAYRSSTGGPLMNSALLQRTDIPCAQWARAKPKYEWSVHAPIPKEDFVSASPLDLIMGFAGLHYNYAQSIAGAVILPRPEAIKTGGFTLRRGLLDCKFVKTIERVIDTFRDVPLMPMQALQDRAAMDVDDKPAAAKRKIHLMSD